MKILELSYSYTPETFVWEHLSALSHNQNLTVRFMHPMYKAPAKSSLLKFYEPKNLSGFVRLFGKVFKAFPKQYAFQKNFKLIKQYNPDLIHCHFGWTATAYFDVLEKVGIPYTVSLRGSDVFVRPLFDDHYKKDLRKVLSNASAIHVVSENLKKHITAYYDFNCPVTIIRTPIDKNNWLNNDSSSFATGKIKLITVGRLHWIKDFGELIAQFAKVSKKNEHLELTVIGNGPEREKLVFLIDKFNLQNKVRLLGKQPKEIIRKELQSADVYLLTSWSEGFSNALVEAVMAKVLCIVPNHLSIENIFNDEQICFYDKFAHDDLSKAIIRGIELNLDLKNKMKKSAYDKAISVFSHDKHAVEFQSFFELALDN